LNFSIKNIEKYKMEYKLLPRQPYVDNYTVFKDNGDMIHYQNEEIHKDDDFAYHLADGSKAWYTQGAVQRPGGLPSIIKGDGSKHWRLGDRYYRENDLPHEETVTGIKKWYDENEVLVSKQLPNGTRLWYNAEGKVIKKVL